MAEAQEKVIPAQRIPLTGTVIDHSGPEIRSKTIIGPESWTIISPQLGRVVIVEVDGIFVITLPASVVVINGDYLPLLGVNQLWLHCVNNSPVKYLASWSVPV